MEDNKAAAELGCCEQRSWFDRMDSYVEATWVGRYFCLKDRQTRLTTELRAGTVTFLTMAYILAVNGAIVADTGGACTADDCTYNRGVPGCQFGDGGVPDAGYMDCREVAKRSMTSATAVSSMVACVLMGIVGNLPFAIAPGMGMNAFFTYTVVGYFGQNGMVSYRKALAACFIEGWLAFLISISGMRGAIVKSLPNSVMLATSGGIGFFLAFIGFQTSNGIGLVSYEPTTLVTLGGCPIEDRARMYIVPNTTAVCVVDADTGVLIRGPNLGIASTNYFCLRNRMRSPSLWLGICGGLLMVLMMGRGFKGAIINAILFVTFVSWIPGHGASYLGPSSMIPFGEKREAYFKKVVDLPNTSATDLSFDFSAFKDRDVWAALFSFLYLDFLDTTGTFYSMATYINKKMPGFIHPETKEFPRITAAFCVDATATWIGALLGIPPLTTYIESATGIREGGRTGITALVVGFYFFLAMFFSPIIASIPPFATGPALVLVGALMIENLTDIQWRHPQQAIPAFATVAVIPLTYSVAYGIIAGIGMYITLYIIFLLYDVITAPLRGVPLSEVFARHRPNIFVHRDRDRERDYSVRDGARRSAAGAAAATTSSKDSSVRNGTQHQPEDAALQRSATGGGGGSGDPSAHGGRRHQTHPSRRSTSSHGAAATGNARDSRHGHGRDDGGAARPAADGSGGGGGGGVAPAAGQGGPGPTGPAAV